MTAEMHRQRSKAFISLGAALFALFVALTLSSVGNADTQASPDTTTNAVLNPNPSAGCSPVPPAQATAPCATHTNGTAAPGTFNGVNGGDALSIHIDGQSGTFIGVTRTALCRGSLQDVQLSAQILPSNGDCVPANGLSNGEPGNGNHSAGGSNPPNSYVDYTFKVGSGTYTPPGGTAITCDASNPCAVWIQESVTNSVDQSGYVFKHYTVNYTGGGIGPTTTTTTATTLPTGPTTTTTTAPTTTTGPTTTESTTSTSTVETSTSTTSTTAPSGTSVSPTSAAPGQPFSVQSTGWMPCSGATGTTSTSTSTTAAPSTTSTTACPSVTVTFQSDPITLGTLTPDASGAVSGQFNVPAGAAAGSHKIVLSGTDPAGAARTIALDFTVTGSSSGSGTGGAAGGGSSATGTNGTGSGAPLALTGVQLRMLRFGLVAVAIGLILVGAAHGRRAGFDQ